MQPKVIICGTGRAATSWLMQLLTRLKLPTGWPTPEADVPGHLGYDPRIRAGYEWHHDWQHGPPPLAWWASAPQIIKNPEFSFWLEDAIGKGVPVGYCVVPIRPLAEAAHSRLSVFRAWGLKPAPGETQDSVLAMQTWYLAKALGTLTAVLISRHVPHTFVDWRQLTDNPWRCYGIVEHVAAVCGSLTTYADFIKAFRGCARSSDTQPAASAGFI